MLAALAAVLRWEPQIRGVLVVLTAVVLLPGSVFMLLSTNTGARLGFLLAATGLMGWISIMTIVWTVYGIGLKGRAAVWKPQGVVVGEPAKGALAPLSGFPNGWKTVKLEDPKTAEAAAAADGLLATGSSGKGPFKSSSEYVAIAAYSKGGQRYGPLGLDFRPFNFRHKPHYFLYEVQRKLPSAPGQKSRPDPTAPVASAILLRDLGALRQPPAVIATSSLLLFGVLVSTLHRRDRLAMQTRAEAAK